MLPIVLLTLSSMLWRMRSGFVHMHTLSLRNPPVGMVWCGVKLFSMMDIVISPVVLLCKMRCMSYPLSRFKKEKKEKLLRPQNTPCIN